MPAESDTHRPACRLTPSSSARALAATRWLTGRRSRRGVPALLAATIVAGVAATGCGSGKTDIGSSTQSSSTSPQLISSSVAALLSTGIAEANAKQYQQAATTFRDVLVVSPKNKLAWYNLGVLAQVQNQASSALANYTKALSIDPKYTPAMYNKAILLERTNPRSALALYQQITSIDPKAATTYLHESFVYQRLGDKNRARQARARAVALEPSLATATSPGS